MEALGESSVEELTRVDFYTSHEGLSLPYESAQTRQVPRRDGWYDLTTHFPWIGERTRAIDGAHVEFFRGIENPVGVKLGPERRRPTRSLRLLDVLNPRNEAGKIALITRMGATKVGDVLPGLVEAVKRAGRRVLWVCDPDARQHANHAVGAQDARLRRHPARGRAHLRRPRRRAGRPSGAFTSR